MLYTLLLSGDWHSATLSVSGSGKVRSLTCAAGDTRLQLGAGAHADTGSEECCQLLGWLQYSSLRAASYWQDPAQARSSAGRSQKYLHVPCGTLTSASTIHTNQAPPQLIMLLHCYSQLRQRMMAPKLPPWDLSKGRGAAHVQWR